MEEGDGFKVVVWHAVVAALCCIITGGFIAHKANSVVNKAVLREIAIMESCPNNVLLHTAEIKRIIGEEALVPRCEEHKFNERK